MVSQFISSHQVRLLGDLDFQFPEGTHAIGRLDQDSEGLLILTTNKKVTKLLFERKVPHERTYLVQVNHTLSADSLHQLRSGVKIKIGAGIIYHTPPGTVEIIHHPEDKYIIDPTIPSYPPFTWILITLREGKYRQVRKMMTAVRHKTKRLIRVSIANMTLGAMKPGEVREVSEDDFMRGIHAE